MLAAESLPRKQDNEFNQALISGALKKWKLVGFFEFHLWPLRDSCCLVAITLSGLIFLVAEGIW